MVVVGAVVGVFVLAVVVLPHVVPVEPRLLKGPPVAGFMAKSPPPGAFPPVAPVVVPPPLKSAGGVLEAPVVPPPNNPPPVEVMLPPPPIPVANEPKVDPDVRCVPVFCWGF